ncbi:MAG TPA: hypothetical protein PLP21_08810 [Pyrinomonadaceae bacterium]|nr:hypothetical protein [Acidobacteriota bacterium]HQZ96406.1 hypothetical protein [Pyrinomonadaceae bacterium]
MSTELIAEIFATYRKYGWVPRRLLLTDAGKKNIENPEPELPVYDAEINAAWFSRPPANGEIAWEIRYLGNTPYALLENLDEASPDFEDRLKDVQKRLKASVAAKQN